MSHLVAGQKIGKYEIIRDVNSSNAVVYEAWDPDLRRRVAIKDLAPFLEKHKDPNSTVTDAQVDILARFARELEIMGRLVHPNILMIFDGGFDTDETDPKNPIKRPYIAMEFLVGQSLQKLIGSPLALQRIIEIIEQLLSALKCAHEAGVVHRDIKPENIQVLPNGTVKLMDFGISSLLARSRITRTGMLLGTLHYLSPEQAMGQAVDHRTDLFAVGTIVFELATGRWPFHGGTQQETLAQIISASPDFTAITHPALRAFLDQALQKSPDRRFQSATDMRNALLMLVGSPHQSPSPKAQQGGPQIILPPPPPIPPPGFWPQVCFWTKRIVGGLLKGLWVFLKWLHSQYKAHQADKQKQYSQPLDYWPLVTLGLGVVVVVKTCGFFADYGTRPPDTAQTSINQSASSPLSSTPVRSTPPRSSVKGSRRTVHTSPPRIRQVDTTHLSERKESSTFQQDSQASNPEPKQSHSEPVAGVDYPAPRVKHPDEPPTRDTGD